MVSNVLGGDPVDFTQPNQDGADTGVAASNSSNKVVINYIDSSKTVTNLYWTYTALGTTDGDDLLETGEKFEITIGSDTAGASGGNLIDALNPNYLSVNDTFTLEILTPVGAVLVIERTTPHYIDTKMNLR